MRAGPTTRLLCALVAAASMLTAVARRSGWPGPATWAFSAEQVWAGELWRPLTYGLVCQDEMHLLLSCLALWILGGLHEGRQGGRSLAWLVALSSIGGGILALVLHPLINLLLPFTDRGLASGPGAAIDGLLVALAVAAPGARVLWGFVLPIPAATGVWLLLGLHVVSGVMRGEVGDLSVRLGGMIVAWLVSSGRWRPRSWRRRQVVRRPAHLYAVPVGDRRLN